MQFQKQRGIVILTSLIFLAIISLLVIGVVEAHLLEVKMSHYYYAKAKTFLLADKGLKNALACIAGKKVKLDTNTKILIKQRTDSKSSKIYFIKIEANYLKARSIVESAYTQDKSGKLKELWWKLID